MIYCTFLFPLVMTVDTALLGDAMPDTGAIQAQIGVDGGTDHFHKRSINI